MLDPKIKYTIIGLVVAVTLVILGLTIRDWFTLKPTLPPGAVSCHKDYDCKEGQYCGFTAPYTAAHCKD